MIITFAASIFDIIDVRDFCCADGTQIFSTDNPNADNEHNSLEDSGITYTVISNFIIPDCFQTCNIERTLLSGLSADTAESFFYTYLPKNLNHPPKVLI